MPMTPPIACTLHPSDAEDREVEIRALGRDGLLDLRRGAREVVLRFAADEATRGRVDAIAAAEATCCAFLSFDVTADADAVAVRITAPEGGEPIMHELADLFAADAR